MKTVIVYELVSFVELLSLHSETSSAFLSSFYVVLNTVSLRNCAFSM